ncbi:single-stranded-DNA-specific exonuclease RecJ [Emticicia sp. CRIBPO]|uniref:single-stranded-DNA-specific exonuclease RecJ n=1 Tax=Emticicia sp. CRIBPO TaxID=2683258 RepID=UPI001412D2FC|nr:single-stranded-DNA-specific exonuclease RecJ [Emticicia sp. CRIBPO]NBA86901.1 single-stranded-DNA-specific exonuclease RecJ [Emticicia sp. CRIBPO]
MVEKRWKLQQLPESAEDLQATQSLIEKLSISPVLANILWQRGVHDFDEAKTFFRPQLSHLHDPFLMKDMDRAVERLEQAISLNQKIMVYGDYDVDGTTAVALVYGFLSGFYEHLTYYNPDRYTEGYGVSVKGIDQAAEMGVSLIICLDCGIKAADKVQYAREKYGIDFIICDHHEPGEDLPEAVAVLDPKRKDCEYPFKELTGNGVGFKLLTAYCLRNDIPFEKLCEYLDLAMVSIASDIVPIVGENRTLAYFGLKKMNENPRQSLKALKQVAGHQGEMSIESVVFVIGPRINAAGRIKHAKAAVELLLSDDFDEALAFAYKIQENNTERKGLDAKITDEALGMIRGDEWMLNQARSTVLFNENWHKGVIGIVASRCIEHFYRPTIIFTKTTGDYAAGSARSVVGFNLYEAIEECSHLLEQFGGHMHAAGMTIPIENIQAFRLAFDTAVNNRMGAEPLIPEINIDLEIGISDIDRKFYRILKQMSPFGPKNMQPVFVSRNLRLASTPRILKEKHLKIDVLDTGTGAVLSAIGFGMVDDFYKGLAAGRPFDMVYSIDENTFRGQTSLQLFIRDIKFA